MALFRAKTHPVDWAALRRVDLDLVLQRGDETEVDKLEALYDMIVQVMAVGREDFSYYYCDAGPPKHDLICPLPYTPLREVLHLVL